MTTFTIADQSVTLSGDHNIRLTGSSDESTTISLSCAEETTSVVFASSTTTPAISLNLDNCKRVNFGKWAGSGDPRLTLVSQQSPTTLQLTGPLALQLDDKSSFAMSLESANYIAWSHIKTCSVAITMTQFNAIDIGERSVVISRLSGAKVLEDERVTIDRTTYVGALTLIDQATGDFTVSPKNPDGSSCTQVTEGLTLQLTAHREITLAKEWADVRNVKSITIDGKAGNCHIIYQGSGSFPEFTIDGDATIDIVGPDEGNKKSLPPGAIAGIVIAVLIVCAAVIVIVVICLRKKHYEQIDTQSYETAELSTSDI